jgi:hypothetical protein
MKSRNGHARPAAITPIQKDQRQVTVDMKPEIPGPNTGPKVIAAMSHSSSAAFGIVVYVCTYPKRVRLRSVKLGDDYTYPPTTAIGQAPDIPTNNRNIIRAGQFGARALPIENTVKRISAYIIVHFLPNDPLNDPNNSGPKVYPARNMDVEGQAAPDLSHGNSLTEGELHQWRGTRTSYY